MAMSKVSPRIMQEESFMRGFTIYVFEDIAVLGLNARWQSGVQTVNIDTAVDVYLSVIISRLTKSQPKKACGPWLIGGAATQSITGSAGTSMGDVPSCR